jgi:glucosamine--fructose-6-phosphate aminotransferase (isomerizing)
MISSECYGFDSKIIKYIPIDNNDIIMLHKNEVNRTINMKSFENKIYTSKKISNTDENHSPNPYSHWTLKEINDQVISCINATGMGGRIINGSLVKLGGLEKKKEELLDVKNVIFLGCGTSYHAGLLGTYLFKNLCKFNNVAVYDGANFSENDIPKFGKTCIIFVSQSGETKDLHRCLELCRTKKLDTQLITVGVINVIDSLIAREVDCGIYLNCGREFAVASTKAFSSQVIVLTLMAIWYSQNQQYNQSSYQSYITKILRLQHDISTTIDTNTDKCKQVAKILKNRSSVFILGRDEMECISKEGALKMKEIGYIHAEGYNSSALKHGPYALLDDNFPTILLIPNDKNLSKNKGILDELKSRGSFVIGISDQKVSDKFDELFIVPENSYIEICITIILQLIAYYLAIEKGINPDFPRHIAKVLSVD